MSQIERTWNEIMKISDCQVGALKTYGKFLIEIINDEEKGLKIIKRAQLLSLDKSKTKQGDMMAGKEGISSECPVIIADCDIKRLGYIR